MDEERQVVGGVIPDQEDAGGNFSQTDPGGGPGDRPLVRPYREPLPANSADSPDGALDPDEDGGPSALPPEVTGE